VHLRLGHPPGHRDPRHRRDAADREGGSHQPAGWYGAIHVTDGTNNAWCAGLAHTDRIVIKAASPAAYQHTIIDERTGDFGPGATKESTGLSEIEVSVLTGTGGDQLTVMQSAPGVATCGFARALLACRLGRRSISTATATMTWG
jgi:hypothetical protein